MLAHYGGLDGFAASWANYQRRVTKKGGPASLRCMQTVLRIMECVDQQRSDPTEMMTDEELRESVMQHTKELISLEPALALVAANELGWTIAPPHSVTTL
jgi:hypothetical protein